MCIKLKKMEQTQELPRSTSNGVAPNGYGCLGREMKISPKTLAITYDSGYGMTFNENSVEVVIGIGTNHTAHLFMSIEAYDAWLKGEPMNITTLKEFSESNVRGMKRKKRK